MGEVVDAGATAEYARVEDAKTRLNQLHTRERELRQALLDVEIGIAAAESTVDEAVNARVSDGRDPTLWIADDVLIAILLVVPTASLWKKQCSLVCRRWARVVRDPAVQRRLREGKWEAYAAKWIEPRLIGGRGDPMHSLAIGSNGVVYSATAGGTKAVTAWSTKDGAAVWSLDGFKARGICSTIAVSLDDEVYLAIQSSSISVWRGQDGSHVRTLEGHTGVVWVVAADGRENKVYSGSADHTVRVWAGGDSSGACTRVLEGHADDVRALAIGVDGKVYSGSDDCSIRVWAGDDGAHLNTLVGHVQGVTALVCSPQGTVYSGSEDNTIRAWSGADGALLRTLQGHTGEVFSMACCPDGRLVSIAADSTLRVWSCEHDLNRPLATVTERAEDVVICGGDGLVYSTGECSGISVW